MSYISIKDSKIPKAIACKLQSLTPRFFRFCF